MYTIHIHVCMHAHRRTHIHTYVHAGLLNCIHCANVGTNMSAEQTLVICNSVYSQVIAFIFETLTQPDPIM